MCGGGGGSELAAGAQLREDGQEQLAHLLHFQTLLLLLLLEPGFQTKLALARTSAAAPATRRIWIRLGS